MQNATPWNTASETRMSVRLTQSRIDATQLLEQVGGNSNGAAILFVGAVRDNNQGRAVSGIDYSAYIPMAEKELQAIALEAANRFHVANIVIEHRLGTLELGELSVAIAVGHPHRAAAYDASRFIIEEIKKRVPIWKREHYADGSREWVDPSGAPRTQEVME
jgi:molybdopterin synthase catalytic subunit